MDLSELSLSELRALQLQIPLEFKRREAQDKANVLNEIRAIAKARGYALDDLVTKEAKVKASSGNKVKVKYRHPEDATLEWTGRGRKPKWVDAWLAAEKSMEALSV